MAPTGVPATHPPAVLEKTAAPPAVAAQAGVPDADLAADAEAARRKIAAGSSHSDSAASEVWRRHEQAANAASDAAKAATHSIRSPSPVDISNLSQEERRATICRFLSHRTRNEAGQLAKGALDETAKKFGISRSGVSGIWKRHKFAVMYPDKFNADFSRKKGSGRARKWAVEEVLEKVKNVKFAYRQSLRSLSEKTGIPRTTLHTILKKNSQLPSTKSIEKRENEPVSIVQDTRSELPVPPHPCQRKFAEGVLNNQRSKIVTGGSLQGVIYPSRAKVPEVNLPSLTKQTTYKVTVPETVLEPSDGSITMSCVINGKRNTIKIPEGLQKDDTFTFTRTHSETGKVFTSTLRSLPEMDIVQSKPIIWSSVSYDFYKKSADQQAMGNAVGKLTQEAQAKILEQVVEHRCNACLGMSFNVTTDSSGPSGNKKLVVVTAHGTPCVVVPTSTATAVDAAEADQPSVE